jgi:uncharacterized protein (TIGR02001 family)
MVATFSAGLALSATPALAETNETTSEQVGPTLEREVEEIAPEAASYAAGESGFEFSANVAMVSEYRFRGVDLSGGDIAVQGGVDLAHESGFYIGTWGSSLDEDTVGYGHTEIDVYAGFGGSISDAVSFDLGVLAYLYPNAGPGDFDYVELYGSLGFNLGPAEATVGVAYAPDQDSLGDTDNLYLYTDLGIGIPETPLTVTGHLGYTDGFLTFTDDGKAWDWSIGIEAAVSGPVSVGIAYVGAEGDPALLDDGGTPDILNDDFIYDFTDDAVVFTVSASF